ncbi:MAG: LysO family transporter, partial [Myxococcales bacterium]|nr:LysO family transporter [Myxococcales bacterium]
AATAAAGATAMDTALPFLVRSAGPGVAVPAVVSGGLSSLAAPWTVAAVLAWAST